MSDVRFLLFVPETVEHMARATPNEVRQLVANAHVTTDNPADPSGERRLLIGRTDGGRVLTVVIEATPRTCLSGKSVTPRTWVERHSQDVGCDGREEESCSLGHVVDLPLGLCLGLASSHY